MAIRVKESLHQGISRGELGRSREIKVDQWRSGEIRAGQGWGDQGRSGEVRAGLGWGGQGRLGEVRGGQGRSGLVWAGEVGGD